MQTWFLTIVADISGDNNDYARSPFPSRKEYLQKIQATIGAFGFVLPKNPPEFYDLKYHE